MDNKMTLVQWLLTLIISAIPCVGLVFLIIWAVGNGEYTARKTFAQAYLIVMVVIYVISFIIGFITGAAGAAIGSGAAMIFF